MVQLFCDHQASSYLPENFMYDSCEWNSNKLSLGMMKNCRNENTKFLEWVPYTCVFILLSSSDSTRVRPRKTCDEQIEAVPENIEEEVDVAVEDVDGGELENR